MTYKLLKANFLAVLIGCFLSSCSTNKDILYFQDAQIYKETEVAYRTNTLQPNDIIQVNISASLPETAIPYNRIQGTNINLNNTEAMNLRGYLVSPEGYITLPILGKIEVWGQTTTQLEQTLLNMLKTGDHLVDPSVNVRLVNGKVTVLGEVRNPGTFVFLEQNLTVTQALGLAGDLTINGKRNDILLIREEDSKRRITHIDLTTAAWMVDPEFSKIKPNDVLVVQPNKAKVKTAGYIGNVSTLIAVTSTILSITILLTR